MKTALSIVFLALLFCTFNYCLCVKRPGELVDNNDCCQLEWRIVNDKGNGRRFIPSSAISLGKTVHGFDIYFFMGIEAKHFGLINSTTQGLAFVGPDGLITWGNGHILSNPNKCHVSWQDEPTNDEPIDSVRYNLPSYHVFVGRDPVSANHFGAHYDPQGLSYFGYFDQVIGSKTLYAYNIDKSHFRVYNSSLVFLRVDCIQSLNDQVVAELIDVDFDVNSLVGENGSKEKVLASTEVLNEGDDAEWFKVNLDATIAPSLKMSHETVLPQFVQTEWGLNETLSTSFALIEDTLDLSPLVPAEEKARLKDQFVKSGKLSFLLDALVYKFHEDIKVAPKTSVKVVIKTKPIRGHKDFTAYYRITPSTSYKMWTNKRILGTLERLGFEDLRLIEEVNGELVLAVEGRLSINTGLDTQVSIITRPLDSQDSTETFYKKLIPTN